MSRRIKLVTICFDFTAGRWPHGENRALLEEDKHRYGGAFAVDETLTVECYKYPIYSIYEANGWQLHPESQRPGDINNILTPDDRIVDRLRLVLRELATRYDVILWEHASHCYASVAAECLPLFKLAILRFGDDCPGSSERKTFPSARYFDAFIHRMLVWEYSSGRRVPDVYRERGFTGKCYHEVGCQTGGLWDFVHSAEFCLTEKLNRMASLPIDLVFLGSIGFGNPLRRALLEELNARSARDWPKLQTKLHGALMRDGVWTHEDIFNPGWAAGVLYRDCRASVNYPASSIFNGRLFDLPLTGTIQLIHDKNHELEAIGMKNGEHYLEYDGTADGLMRVVEETKSNPAAAVVLATQADAHIRELRRTHNISNLLVQLLKDFSDRF